MTNKTHDPVSEAIEKEFANTKFAKGGGACFECCDYEGMYTDLLSFAHRIATLSFAHRIAALSYAHGVEDSARVCEKAAYTHKNTSLLGPEQNSIRCAAAIRSLTPNEKKV